MALNAYMKVVALNAYKGKWCLRTPILMKMVTMNTYGSESLCKLALKAYVRNSSKRI